MPINRKEFDKLYSETSRAKLVENLFVNNKNTAFCIKDIVIEINKTVGLKSIYCYQLVSVYLKQKLIISAEVSNSVKGRGMKYYIYNKDYKDNGETKTNYFKKKEMRDNLAGERKDNRGNWMRKPTLATKEAVGKFFGEKNENKRKI